MKGIRFLIPFELCHHDFWHFDAERWSRVCDQCGALSYFDGGTWRKDKRLAEMFP